MNHKNSRKRYHEIATVLGRHGFGWLWSKWGIGEVLGKFEKHSGEGTTVSLTEPERLRFALEELGTTAIKLGQVLTTRPDLLPPDTIAELTKLQDQAPTVPFDEIASILRREFGAEPEATFQSFEPQPLAAASIAQVHRARLPDGTNVVVKVRRPNIEEQVDQDLSILRQMARFLAQNTEFGKKLDIESLVDEFAITLKNELDFEREGRNAERLATDFAGDPALLVPAIYWDYSTNRVLTMQEVQGIKILDHDALAAAGIDRKELAQRCAHIALVQVLEHGFFHADPHPGNFFVQPDGVIALLDYGMVGRVSDRTRESLVRLALAISRHDAQRLCQELLSLGTAKGPVDRDAIVRDLERLLEDYSGVPIGQISAERIFEQVLETVRKHDLRLPSELVLLARVVVMDEGMGRSLDPEFQFIEFSQPYFERFWRKSHSWEQISRRLTEGAIELADFGKDLPQRLHRLISMSERGELTVTSRLEVPDPMLRRFQDAANRIAISILMAGLIVGLSVLTQATNPAGSEAFASLVLRGLLAVAVVAGVWLIGAFWKSVR